MDLLGSYSSSDDDDSSSGSERSRSPPTPIVKKSLLQAGTLPPSVPSAKKPAAVKGKAAAATIKRGKKLISLHSVLPPSILEQLTKSATTGSFEYSSDEDNETHDNRKEAPKKKASKLAASKDEGIANFLSALGSAETSSLAAKKNEPKSKGEQGSGKLGAAFLSVTSTTTTRTKRDGSKQSTTTAGDARATPTHQGDANNGSPSHYKPLSLSPRTAFHPFRTSAVAAAPPVPMPATGAATMPPQSDNTPRQVVAPPPPVTATVFAMNTGTAASQGGSSRSKRRQLQKALRAGNLDQALAVGGANVTNLQQAQPTAFVEPETYAVPTHGVRVVATQMYNPKAGADVQANLGAVRSNGKNQINHLMASAANFELQQARSGQKTNNQRAGAKRKYGW